MNVSNVRRWVKEFMKGREDVFNEKRSGRPYLVYEEVVEKIDNVIRKDRPLTLDKLHKLILDISRSVIYEAITGKLAFDLDKGVGGRDLQGGYTKVDP